MYELFIDICGVPDEIFEESVVLQEWFSVCSMVLCAFSIFMLCWVFVSIFRIFGGRKC